MNPFYTIGHSTRSITEFVDLLCSARVTAVVDVRTVPRSRTNPQYNLESLPASLSEFKIAYQHIASLGGCAARSTTFHLALTVSGRIRVFTTTPTTPWVRHSIEAWLN